MVVFVNFLKRNSPPPQLPAYGHGWLALPDGKRWNPADVEKKEGGKRG